ncbi:hypothetical protein VAE130_550477 [Vibrio aestuarianus]|nr:hypothetical protein VAE308_1010472 [Vibrio aestuarianus]CAH8188622.1 hypothetical protein VAE032_250003 [Vibrio aestuarianus]CAH8188889.1 hypothetical protein VAE128_440474 [Vibrio aestuarianus]CAH8189066.1 hypothetical protein VAE130_550477 [Vibrio aestuarianus]CAH8189335.1 hypothetical protein VAE115_300003 [Vibrio aestuarianus]
MIFVDMTDLQIILATFYFIKTLIFKNCCIIVSIKVLRHG